LNLNLAQAQHRAYCRVLEDLGLEIIELPIDEEHPDSCFVEDTAIIQGKRAVITRMAKESRRGEESPIQETLQQYKQLIRIKAPGTIEGGDVIHLNDSMISGITERTNHSGVAQTAEWLKVSIEKVEDKSIIHLKSHVTFLNDETLVVTTRFASHPVLAKYRQLIIPKEEEYAANTLTIDGSVIMSSRHPKSLQIIKDAGFIALPIDMSEFEKCEGAITCLSLIF
jgi:dimethylargininase